VNTETEKTASFTHKTSKKVKTLSQEQRAVHEAYQVLLSEYPKQIKRRKKQRKPP
jgi:hypothetical protein